MALSHASTISAFYLAYFGRPADPDGLAFWTMQLDNANGDLSQLTAAFAQSEEAIKQYGSSDTITHITQVYQQLFNRAPDAEGLAFWVNAIDKGNMSLADAAVKIQAGAQSTDMQLSQLRAKLADQFTQKVADGEFAYSGYASLEAARVLVKAVNLEMSSADADAIVGFSLKLADIATKTPAVVDAIATGTTLAKLLDTARGAADPVKLVQALADIAEAAAGNPVTLDSLLRSGGMLKVLEVMPAQATLSQVVNALATGGLPAAVEVVYPTAPTTPTTPTVPTPPPEFSVALRQGVLTFTGTSSDAVVVDLTNNVITRDGKPVSVAGITTLSDVVASNYAGNVFVLGSVADVAKVMAVPSGVDYYSIVDVKSAFFNGVVGERALAGTVASLIDSAHTVTITDTLSVEEMAVIEARASFELGRLTATVDSEAPDVTAGFVSITESGDDHAPDFVTNQDEITVKAVLDAALAEGDYVQYSVDGQTWTTVAAGDIDGTTVSVKGIDATSSPTVSIRVVDAAGNPGQVIGQKISYDNTPATQTVTIDSITQDDGDTPDGLKDFVTNEKTASVEATLSDELAAGEYVQYSVDGELWIRVSAKDVDGTSVTIRDIDVSGSPALLVRVVDAAGNPGVQATRKIDYDTTAATQTVKFDTISEDEDDSADSTADFVTNQTTATVTATLSGVLATGEYVQYSVNGQDWTTLEAGAIDGTAVTIAGIASSTSPTLQVRVVDAAGNPGTNATQAITFDNAGATQTVEFVSISEDKDDSADQTPDFTTNVASATVAAKLSAVLGAGEYVQYSVNGTDWTTLATDAVNGTAVTIAGIATATSPTLQVRVVDAAGNPGAKATQAITYDNVGATQTVAFRAISEDTKDSADHTADYVTNQADITVEGELSAALGEGEYVQYSVDGKTWTEVDAKDIEGLMVSAKGIDASTSPTVAFRVVDAAGNPGQETEQAITYDVVAATQTVTIDSITEDDGATPDGHEDFVTNEHIVTVKATLSDVLAAGEYVQYSLDGSNWFDSDAVRPLSVNINLVPQAGITVDGTAVTIHGIDVSDNPTLLVRVVDAAGNPGTQASQAITYDDVAATQTVTIDTISQDEGDSADSTPDFVTNQATATVTATLSDALATGEYVQYKVNGTDWTTLEAGAIDGTAVTIAGIATSTSPTLQVRVVDAAGNPGAEATQAITYDNVGASQTVTFVAITEDQGNSADQTPDFTTNVAEATVEAKLSAALGKDEYVQYSVDGKTWSTLAADAVDGRIVTIAGIDTTTSPTFSIRVVDAAGNEGVYASKGIVFDDEAPTQTITIDSLSEDALDISEDFTTNQANATVRATLSASLNAGDYVQYSTDGETWLDHTAYLPRGMGINVSLSGILVDGTSVTIYGVDVSDSPSLRVRVVDAAGNPGEAASQAITYDDVAPTVSVTFDKISESDEDSSQDLTTNESYAKVEATLSAELSDGEYVQFSLDGIHWTTATVPAPDRMSTFDMPDSRATVDGTALTIYGIDVTDSPTLRVRVIDAAGNFKEPAEQKITYDNEAPLNTLTIDAVSQDDDDISDDFITNQDSATITATLGHGLEDGERVQYSTDGTTWTSVAAENVVGKLVTIDGIDLTGSPTLSLRLIDAAGNSTQAVEQLITYDGKAPSVGDIAFSQVTQGRSDTRLDNVTNVAAANVDFTYTGEGIGTGEQYQWSTDGKTWHTESIDVFTSTKTVRVKSIDLTKGEPAIEEGASAPVDNANLLTTVYLRSIDAAGNKSTEVSQQIVYDHFAAKPTLSLTTDSHGSNVGTDDDHVTNDATLTMKGVETSAKLEYSANGVNGWSTTEPTTVQGPNKYFVRQTDKAGNTSAVSEIKFTLDNINPGKPTIALDSDTGSNATDGVTNKGLVKISGLETSGSTIWEYSTDNGETWTKGGLADEEGEAELDLTLLGDGDMDVVVRQVDLAGNVGEQSTLLQFTLDTAKPDNTVYFSAVEQATTDANLTELEEARVFFKYTGELDTSGKLQWRLADGNWTTLDADAIDTITKTVIVGPIDLSAGHKTVELRQIDDAGNFNLATQFIKGPYSPATVTTEYDADGVYVTSSASGEIRAYWQNWDFELQLGSIEKNDDAQQGQLVGQMDFVGPMDYGITFGVRATGTNYTSYDQSGRAYVLGRHHDETLHGQYAWGFDGNDFLEGTGGADFLSGGDGDDTIVSSGGVDILNGGEGADTFMYRFAGESVEVVNAVGGFDVIEDFEFGIDKIEFGSSYMNTQDELNIIARPEAGLVIDTTQYESLEQLIAAAQGYLADEEHGSVVAGQVGKDVYILGETRMGLPNHYDRGSDLIIKLENTKVQYLSIDDFTGLTGMHQYVGDLTAIDGVTMPHPITSVNASVLMFKDEHGQGFAMGSIMPEEDEEPIAQTTVAISGVGGDFFSGRKGDVVFIETPDATNLSRDFDIESDLEPSFDVLSSEGEMTVDFGIDVTDIAIRVGTVMDRIPAQNDDEMDTLVFLPSATLVAALDAAYQEAHAGKANAAILLNDFDTRSGLLAVDYNGDARIDASDYALVTSPGIASVDLSGNVVYASLMDPIDGPQEPLQLQVDITEKGIQIESPVNGPVYVYDGQNWLETGIVTNSNGYALIDSQLDSMAPMAGSLMVGEIDGQYAADMSGNNYVFGTGSGDTLLDSNFAWGFGGNDILSGTNGDDFLSSGSGNDELSGMGGADQLFGGSGENAFLYAAATDSFVKNDDTDLTGFDVLHTGGGSYDRVAITDFVDLQVWYENQYISAAAATNGVDLLSQLNTAFQAAKLNGGAHTTGTMEAMLFNFYSDDQYLVININQDNVISEDDLVIQIVGAYGEVYGLSKVQGGNVLDLGSGAV